MKMSVFANKFLITIAICSLASSLFAADLSISESTSKLIKANPADAKSIMSSFFNKVCSNKSTCANNVTAEDLVVNLIKEVGVQSTAIKSILTAANEAGIDVDVLTSMAIIAGVDVSIASESTASGTKHRRHRRHHHHRDHCRYYRGSHRHHRHKPCKKDDTNNDTTAPVIILLGDNPMSLEFEATYTEPGATVNDNNDTGLTAIITGTVDTSTIGTYELSYNITDAAGNVADTVTRTVNVTPNIGHFSDSDVAGLTYTTASQSGITDAMGTFYYKKGETITFSLGDTTIGDTVTAKAAMTPFDLVPGAVLYTTYAQANHVRQTLPDHNLEKIAFNKFSNILTFLQTLDDDANPDNGINIQSGMAAFFAGVQIDFEIDLTDFSENKKLRIITHQAAKQNLLSTAEIKNEGFALDHFYEAQNISHKFAVKSTRSYDYDADDNVDEVITHTYDSDGNIHITSYDDNGDDILNAISTFTYDANGNKLSTSYDKNADGSTNEINTYYYDANGNVLHIDTDDSGDGNIDFIQTYTYDENGNNTSYYTSPGDGNIVSIRTYTYDENGNVLHEEFDYENDGEIDYSRTSTYDANDNLQRREQDNNGDGIHNTISYYTYDANGNLTSNSYDQDGDGNPNEKTLYTWDNNNNRLSETYIWDIDLDTTPDRVRLYTYDENGNQTSESTDLDYNNITDHLYTFTYDDNHNRLTTTSYLNYEVDQTPSSIRTYSYNSDNNRETYSYDSDGDGNPNELTIYTYDAIGNMQKETHDMDTKTDPESNSIYTNTYTSSTWVGILYAIDGGGKRQGK